MATKWLQASCGCWITVHYNSMELMFGLSFWCVREAITSQLLIWWGQCCCTYFIRSTDNIVDVMKDFTFDLEIENCSHKQVTRTKLWYSMMIINFEPLYRIHVSSDDYRMWVPVAIQYISSQCSAQAALSCIYTVAYTDQTCTFTLYFNNQYLFVCLQHIHGQGSR